MGNHSTAQVKGKGKIDLVFTSRNTLTLKDAPHVPDVHKDLVSGSLLNKFGFELVFEYDKFILSKGGKFVGKGYHAGRMFKLNIKDVVNSTVNDVNMTEISDVNNASAGIVTNDDAINKMPTSSYYFDSSLLWHDRLDEVLEKFKIYKNEVELKCDTRIKCLRTDRGGEYYDPRYFQSTGIVHQVTAPYTLQQNACNILNRVPSKRSIKTPYELRKQRTPKLDYLRIWGCRAIVRLPESKKRKLEDKGIE
ncbi:zinc finger, CCHC-type containing protein [Tanacetum coccineum]